MPNWDGGTQVDANGRAYEQVAANQAAQIIGTVGAVGDNIDGIWIFPATTGPGTVIVLDGAVAIWTWPAGITVTDTRPIFVPLNLKSVNTGWRITTGANVSALAWGQFT